MIKMDQRSSSSSYSDSEASGSKNPHPNSRVPQSLPDKKKKHQNETNVTQAPEKIKPMVSSNLSEYRLMKFHCFFFQYLDWSPHGRSE